MAQQPTVQAPQSSPPGQARAYLDADARRHSVWEAPRRSHLYFKERLRYDHVCAALGPPGRMLDLGCGDGMLAVMAARRGCEVTALDKSPARLEKFAARARALGIRQVEGDAYALPFPARAFDAVAVSEVLEHLPSPEGVIAECERVMRPGGRLVVTVPNEEDLDAATYPCPHCGAWFHINGHVNSFDAGTLAELLSRCGFRVRRMGTFRNGLTEALQGALRLPYGRTVRQLDGLLSRHASSRRFPNRYLIGVADADSDKT